MQVDLLARIPHADRGVLVGDDQPPVGELAEIGEVEADEGLVTGQIIGADAALQL
jgi:hypothetical protein